MTDKILEVAIIVTNSKLDILARCMPELEHCFHYRNIDVSTIKELAKFHKENNHRALDDIKESIAELKHYGDCFIKRHKGDNTTAPGQINTI